MVSSGLKRLSRLFQPSPRRAPRLRLVGRVSARTSVALFASAIVSALVLAPALAHAQAKPRAERPTYTLGEKWVRNDGLYELIRIEKDVYVFSTRPRWEIHLTKDLGIARAQRGDSVLDFSPPIEMKWPLEVGKSGYQNSHWETPSSAGRSFPVAISWRVVDYEDVQVFAGTFKAFHIVLTFTNPGGRSFENHLWYSPEARQYIKADGAHGILRFQLVGLDHPTAGSIQFALEGMPERERVGTDTLTLGGKVTAGKGLASVVVTLNGAEVASKNERRAPKPEIALDVPIKLREGKNVVIVTAVDAEGTTRQEARGVFYLPPRGPAVAGAPPGPVPPIGAPIPPPGAPPLPQLPPPQVPAPPPRAVPLQVTLSSPADQARFDNETVALAGLASGGKSVRRVAVSLNGVEVARQEPGTTSAAVNLPIKLREGQNTVVITATDADGVTQQEVRTVYYEKAAPLTVSFRYPEDRSRVAEESSGVAALVTSSKGVAKVTVALNGTQVHQQSDKAPPRSIAVSAPV